MVRRRMLGCLRRFQLRARLACPVTPFPHAPLRFRTAGFPRYGSKAGLSDGAFLQRMLHAQFASVLRVLRNNRLPLAQSRGSLGEHRHSGDIQSALPQGPSLRRGL